MKKLFLLLFIFTIGFVFVAAADDLAELAKKEKARREEIEKKKKDTKVYTNDDIKNVKSKLAIESDAPADQAATDDANTAAAADASAPSNSEMDLQIKQLQEQRAEQEKIAGDARAAINAGGIYHTYNVDQQFTAERQANQKIAEIDKQIADLQAKEQAADNGAKQKEAPPENKTEGDANPQE